MFQTTIPLLRLSWLLCLCIIFACANPIPPTGGPKDTDPPRLIAEESTPNFLTSFDRKEITLTFDEWIQLKDQNLQIVISPPLLHRPDISLKGKSVTIEFHEDEVLRDQTTYVINFGSSIADLNEGNLLDQYKYVFSTGTFIDSLSVSGSIVNATTGDAAKQVLIILHDNLSDTAFSKVLPAYFTKSNDAGQWKIENIRSDTFNVYALTDVNLNYRYDQAGEKIGFLGATIFIPDTSLKKITLSLFEEDPKISVLDVDRRNTGQTRIILSHQSQSLSISSLDQNARDIHWALNKDTITIWNASPDSFYVIVQDKAVAFDTILINRHDGQSTTGNIFSLVKRSIHPAEAIIVKSTIPIGFVDTMKIRCLLSDTALVENLQIGIDSSDARQLIIEYRWREMEKYSLEFLPGAIRDIFGSANDTVRLNFQISATNSFGQIFADISGLKDSMQYLVELQHPQSGTIATSMVRGVSQMKITFDKLQPQGYQIRIVEDVNANGRWDTGNLMQQRQPERVFIQTLEPLRAGWDLEATLIWEQK